MLHVRFPYAKPLCGNGKALTRGEVLTGGKSNRNNTEQLMETKMGKENRVYLTLGEQRTNSK